MFRSTWLTDILLLALITSLFFGAFLGTRNLAAPDELRYSEIPREMIIDKDYVTPRLNGVKYFEKPPLFYWMQVASVKTFGMNEWSLRLATALMGLFGVLATYLFSRRLYDRKTAWFSALILGSMGLYFGMAHIITLDMTVSIFITISIYLFYLAVQYSSKNTKYYLWGAFAAAAGAMMTKGLIGIIFPIAIIGLWFLVFQRWHLLKQWHLISGLLIFIALAAPWHILVQIKSPEFFNFYFIEQQFLRYATSSAHRYHSPLFYLPVILLGTLPWIYFLPQALSMIKKVRWKNRFEHENELFFATWFLFVFFFFSVSNSKLIPYVLPALPPLAIFIARYLALANKKIKSLVIIYLVTNVILVSAIINIDYFDNHTIKPLVLQVKQRLQPGDEVIVYHTYHQDLPYYLERVVTVNESFDELTFGAEHGDTGQWMIHEDTFQKRWLSNKKIYLFISKKEYANFILNHPKNQGSIIAHGAKDLVITNQDKQT